MNDIVLIDEVFDKNNAGNYHLSVEINETYYASAILDLNEKKYIAFKNISFNKNNVDSILHILENDDFFMTGYQSVKVIIPSPKSTLVPTQLFKPEHAEDYLRFNHILEQKEEIEQNEWAVCKAQLIFSITTELKKIIKEKYSNIKFYHQSTALVNELLKNQGENEKFVAINVHSHFVDILIIENQKLLFHNTYQYNTAKDFLYFIIYVYNQFKLDTELMPLLVTGNIFESSEHYNLLKKYVKQIKLMELPQDYKYSYFWKDIVEHQYISLLSLPQIDE